MTQSNFRFFSTWKVETDGLAHLVESGKTIVIACVWAGTSL